MSVGFDIWDKIDFISSRQFLFTFDPNVAKINYVLWNFVTFTTCYIHFNVINSKRIQVWQQIEMCH